ncbi:MAG: putative beta-lysine N-acetyltransferase [Desulfopila sp.]
MTTIDRIEYFGGSLIQHGPGSDRVYLMKLDKADTPGILHHIDALARQKGYAKIFAKIPAGSRTLFEQGGYRLEAAIPNFYDGREDGLFMARYYHPDRLLDPACERVRSVLARAREKAFEPHHYKVSLGLEVRLATPADCLQMSELYQQVFASYPFPINDPQYLQQTMADNVLYAGVWQDKKLLALASAEVDEKMANAEMTDFATHANGRSRGLAGVLLEKLEALMAEAAIKTCYTIARATSFGMNITFARSHYTFAGTLINNTQISGALESMNVWYKHLDRNF